MAYGATKKLLLLSVISRKTKYQKYTRKLPVYHFNPSSIFSRRERWDYLDNLIQTQVTVIKKQKKIIPRCPQQIVQLVFFDASKSLLRGQTLYITWSRSICQIIPRFSATWNLSFWAHTKSIQNLVKLESK